MRRLSSRLAVACGTLALLLASAGHATASNNVQSSTLGGAGGLAITVHSSFTIYGGGHSLSTNGEQFITTFHSASTDPVVAANSTFRTFCVDLSTATHTGTYNVPVSYTAGTSTDAHGNTQHLGAAGWIVNHYGNASDAALYALANIAGPTSNAVANTALQMAVWEAAYNPTSTNVASGSLYFANNGGAANATNFSNAVAIANAILALRGNQLSAAGFIRYETQSQDMMFAATPEPSTLAIAGFGALGFVGYGLRRKRREA